MSGVSDREAAIRAKRAARAEATSAKAAEQRATDLEAIYDLEDRYGETNISTIEIPYVDGLPVVCAVKTADEGAVKRYDHETKPKKGQDPDRVAAAERVAAVCVVYPERDVFDQMCAARYVLKRQAGIAAIELATGAVEAEGKG